MASGKKKVKKTDPISERTRVLNEQINSLEAEIKRLDVQIQRAPPPPRLRSTAMPHGATVAHAPEPPAPVPAAHDLVFEEIKSLPSTDETSTPDQFNELGVRKYDLPALINRIRRIFRRPTTSNPRLVAYLAAGGVQGLCPLRYEKRVARNRFLVFVIVLVFALLGLFYALLHSH